MRFPQSRNFAYSTKNCLILICIHFFRIFFQVLMIEAPDTVISFFKYLLIRKKYNPEMLRTGQLPKTASGN